MPLNYEFFDPNFGNVPVEIRNTRNEETIQQFLKKIEIDERNLRQPNEEDRTNLLLKIENFFEQVQSSLFTPSNEALDSFMVDIDKNVHEALAGYPGPLDQEQKNTFMGHFYNFLTLLQDIGLYQGDIAATLTERAENALHTYTGCLLSENERKNLTERIKNNQEFDKVKNDQHRHLNNRKLTAPVKKNGRIELKNIHQTAFQTTRNGCWSVSYQLLLQSRGIHLSQQQIRSYREDMNETQFRQMNTQTQFGETDKLFNQDVMSSPAEHAGLLMELRPNTAMRSVTLAGDLSVKQFAAHDKKNAAQKSKEAIRQRKEAIRKIITTALVDDCSPVSYTNGNHFLTIVGIENDTVLYKNSLAKGSNPDQTYQMPLEDIAKTTSMNFFWLHDISVRKDGTSAELDNVSDLSSQKGGTLVYQPAAEQINQDVEIGGYGMNSYIIRQQADQNQNQYEPYGIETFLPKRLYAPQPYADRTQQQTAQPAHIEQLNSIRTLLDELHDKFQATNKDSHKNTQEYNHMIDALSKLKQHVGNLGKKTEPISTQEYTTLDELKKKALYTVNDYLEKKGSFSWFQMGRDRRRLASRLKETLQFDVQLIQELGEEQKRQEEQKKKEAQNAQKPQEKHKTPETLDKFKPQAALLKKQCDTYQQMGQLEMAQLGKEAQNAMSELVSMAIGKKKYESSEAALSLAKILCFNKLDSMKIKNPENWQEMTISLLNENAFQTFSASLSSDNLHTLLTVKDGFTKLNQQLESKGTWKEVDLATANMIAPEEHRPEENVPIF